MSTCFRALRAIAIAALVLAGLVSACGATGHGSLGEQRSAYQTVVDPPTFVYITQTGRAVAWTVELRSPVTGQIVGVLARYGESLTSNGLALSPDARHVYITVIGRGTLRIERIDAADRARSFVADGEQPAVSPDGRLLAYATGPSGSDMLAIRDLSSGETRSVDLARVMGRSSELLDGAVTWLGDASEVVVMPAPVPVAVALPAGVAAGGRSGSCSTVISPAVCLIVVHLSAGDDPLTARLVVAHGVPAGLVRISGAGALSRSLLLADALAKQTIIDQVQVGGPRPRVTRVAALAPVLPVAFDLAGTHLLYLVGHSPPALWVGQLAPGRLVDPHRLIANADLGSVAW
jgi:hypothetical protein